MVAQGRNLLNQLKSHLTYLLLLNIYAEVKTLSGVALLLYGEANSLRTFVSPNFWPVCSQLVLSWEGSLLV